jgi:hypothetical protein
MVAAKATDAIHAKGQRLDALLLDMNAGDKMAVSQWHALHSENGLCKALVDTYPAMVDSFITAEYGAYFAMLAGELMESRDDTCKTWIPEWRNGVI